MMCRWILWHCGQVNVRKSWPDALGSIAVSFIAELQAVHCGPWFCMSRMRCHPYSTEPRRFRAREGWNAIAPCRWQRDPRGALGASACGDGSTMRPRVAGLMVNMAQSRKLKRDPKKSIADARIGARLNNETGRQLRRPYLIGGGLVQCS